MRVTTISGMKTSLRHLIGLDALQSSEEDAAVRSFNRFGKLAWDRTTWPFNCVLKQVIPDVRVRSVNVGSGGSGYGSVPAVTIAGSAAGTATLGARAALGVGGRTRRWWLGPTTRGASRNHCKTTGSSNCPRTTLSPTKLGWGTEA